MGNGGLHRVGLRRPGQLLLGSGTSGLALALALGSLAETGKAGQAGGWQAGRLTISGSSGPGHGCKVHDRYGMDGHVWATIQRKRVGPRQSRSCHGQRDGDLGADGSSLPLAVIAMNPAGAGSVGSINSMGTMAPWAAEEAWLAWVLDWTDSLTMGSICRSWCTSTGLLGKHRWPCLARSYF